MELQEAIIARYSCRSFTERAIDSALLKTCVETAGLAPSACNSQPWKFHIIQDPDAEYKIQKEDHLVVIADCKTLDRFDVLDQL